MLDILFRDDHLIAVNKPSGLLVHRSAIDRHETRFALQLVRDQIGQRVYPVHRLDKPTSGVLLFALNSEVARRLGEQFSAQQIHKRYLAIVRGYAPEQGLIDHALSEELDKMTDRRAQQNKPAQPAVTEYRRLAIVELPVCVERYPQTRYSLVDAFPKTGRKHQIRRHMKHIAHPIIGDAKHGKGVHNRFFKTEFDCHRLLLACVEMRFKHPVTQEDIRLQAHPGHDFVGICERFGWEV
ncbi:tRNA pseudouridine65 synthase [Litorivivens lipolytica]|uniref:tRNA pseudouridine synthase C n=1 Tax=Litorivivens lipolytica TaxID=1524264 RepID=A0A7W4Z898_9GAMM|nr:tRNA pseudouridine(65) synthase TruC [Litorivivens lipolytica]MBB3048751.1 tRNA pseudouridine65 synthase [Litorivivens lipolytica]